jgi:hypothetical protein
MKNILSRITEKPFIARRKIGILLQLRFNPDFSRGGVFFFNCIPFLFIDAENIGFVFCKLAVNGFLFNRIFDEFQRAALRKRIVAGRFDPIFFFKLIIDDGSGSFLSPCISVVPSDSPPAHQDRL